VIFTRFTHGVILFHVSDNESAGYLTSKKVKQSHNTPMEARERMYRSYSFMTLALDGVSDECHVPAVFYPWGKDPQYPLYRRLGGPQSQSGHRD
jgi:hypothetical protein